MRIRAKANGNIVDVPDDQARGFIEAGIFEAVDEEKAETGDEDEREATTPSAKRRTYKRRDVTAEE